MPSHRFIALFALVSVATVAPALSQAPSAAEQIHGAVSPAPEALRAGATVLGYADGELVRLREGDGELVCLADDPSDERFHVACYHVALEPFMARGRELRKQGLEREAVVSSRRDEIAGGKLEFPSAPAALYSLTGPDGSFDAETQTVRGGTRVYSIYIAYATGDQTGLSTSPSGTGQPWLMAAGEPWAHIMLVQPSDGGTADDE